jgi:hypothetical protein
MSVRHSLHGLRPPQRPGIEAMTDTQLISTALFQTASHIVVVTIKLEEQNEKKP